MTSTAKVSPDEIRTRFSSAMSAMYRDEVPAYGTLMDLVGQVNAAVLAGDAALSRDLAAAGQLERISQERHGAIRLGTAAELATMRRLFAVMGMFPVGYYDLSEAGVPVHSTAFRPVDEAALRRNPFRVFTSLLRLDLIDDAALRGQAAEILAKRRIFTDTCLALIDRAEAESGLSEDEADRFVTEALETFRWHSDALVSADLYHRLHEAHRLIADVVSFRGPHINHLTPRTLDIDRVQADMPAHGIAPKAVIEGPPRRACPILLRQTSFKALEETVRFAGDAAEGSHTARFGEIEARGIALTPKGRALYDDLLDQVRARITPAANGSNAAEYVRILNEVFAAFPDDWDSLRRQGLGYFEWSATGTPATGTDPEALLAAGALRCDPIIYEDFLPVSAAGIFQSNLGDGAVQDFSASPNQRMFEADLGADVLDEFAHYAGIEHASLSASLKTLNEGH
ncbi:2-oxoadipate dioxygenase/decarboxylase HglS [Falsirhodobacter halotolerans]|uniref:2-oxoadipate dioxygenase/decarboxylase HglS n=1 Tax=Falsirhodobacter halotolerans TaxID=1146892 RepID=UPI001FD1087F|nr:VOC family protein [Falsirhodobacter halotolerans]MCJ8141007.1 VOC family protein [Falsirhodobacter halotolerans]